MKVGTILLTKTNKYIDADGNLPKRPKFDKELLTGILATQGKVTDEGYDMLPLSIQKLVTVSLDDEAPVTIKELASSELLIISRSPTDFNDGKVFRLDSFKCLVKDRRIELWILVK